MSALMAKRMNDTLSVSLETQGATLSSPPSNLYPTARSTSPKKRCRAEAETGSSALSGSSGKSEKNCEKLLFLLEVASDPSMSGISARGGGDKNNEAAKVTKTSIQDSIPAPLLARASEDAAVDAEEARKKRRRIEYALSVLNAGTEEQKKTLEKGVEEAKRKRARTSLASLTGRPIEEYTTARPAPNAGKTKAKAKKTGGDKGPAPGAPPKRRHVRKRTFAEKLMDALSNPSCVDAISWLPAGDSFIVVSPKKFVTDVLPRHFKTAKFESFTRKLNRWGFKRISRPGTATVAYRHEFFRRDAPELCKKMTGGKRDGDELADETQQALGSPHVVAQQQRAEMLPEQQQQQVRIEPAPTGVPSSSFPSNAAAAAAPSEALRENHLATLANLAPAPGSVFSAATSARDTDNLFGMLSLASQADASRPALPSSMGGVDSRNTTAHLATTSANARRRNFEDTLRRAAILTAGSGITGQCRDSGNGSGEHKVPSSLEGAAAAGAAGPYLKRRMAEIAALYSGDNDKAGVNKPGSVKGGSSRTPQQNQGGSYLRRIRRTFQERHHVHPQVPARMPHLPLSPDTGMGIPADFPVHSVIKERDVRLLAHVRAAREQATTAEATASNPAGGVAPADADAAVAIQKQQFRLGQIAAMRARHAQRMRAAMHAHAHQGQLSAAALGMAGGGAGAFPSSA